MRTLVLDRVGRWRGPLLAFSIGPPPNRMCAFQRIRLSSCLTLLGYSGHLHNASLHPPWVDRLPSFALWVAFPPALVGHNSHDYYDGCVAIGLVPRRRSRGALLRHVIA